MLSEAAKLFSENYGTWGERSQNPGKPVKLGTRRLREQYLPDPATESYYIRVTVIMRILPEMRSAVVGSTQVLKLVSLDFAKENAEAIMKASPIPYIRKARQCGTLFETKDSTGLVCGVDTGFFVDHEEPLEALELVRHIRQWPLGELLDGHECLLILPGKRLRPRLSVKPERDAASGR
ncbi:hypothetical protein ACJ73_09921 [Blastomyces percursus]|uniref:Uncharacterized protein n=1 Tax=Blastomyces percursus TaxID=1658174 RepID=A0A1J9P2R8_9EURO|nr:hypothetical protein ACJ73_09921 [Blastomyces percursus]